MKRVRSFVLLAMLAAILAWTLSINYHQPGSRRNPSDVGKLSETIVIYDHETIPAGKGISTGRYTKVDGYRYVNIFVEFEQASREEKPLSLGVMFAHDERGKWGARRYYNFEENLGLTSANVRMLTGERQSASRPYDQFKDQSGQASMDKQVTIGEGKPEFELDYTFEQKTPSAPVDPQMITVSGAGNWHGSPHNRSSYITRLPVMGPYLQVFPFNYHDEERVFSVVVYLTR